MNNFAHKSLLLLFVIILCLLSKITRAESGWEQIKANDNVSARKLFLLDLQKDSLNISALKGLIYLSDIEQDKLSYIKYTNSLIRNFSDEHLLYIFQNTYDETSDFITKQKNNSDRSAFPFKLIQAEKLKEKRQFVEAENAYNNLLPDYRWSLIGPFKNTSGSGHEIKYAVETTVYDSVKSYINNKGLELKWVLPKQYNRTNKISFSNNLTSNYGGETYYANSFITNPKSQTLQLRIAGSSPTKIWVDDFLVFDNKNLSYFEWDGNIVVLTLSKGTHRILVKCSTPPQRAKSYSFMKFFDNPSSAYNNSNSYGYFNYFGSSSSESPSFFIRITDTTGVLLKNILPSPPSNISESQLNPKLSNNFTINYFIAEIEKTPDDLFNYYALSKAFFMAKRTLDAEPIFVKALRQQKDLVFLKYLTAKIYAENGKVEKVYQILSEINQEKTPVFGLLYEKFENIDLATEELKYLDALVCLNDITPSNYSLISAYIKYYEKNGMRKQKEEFIEKMKVAYPVYKESLDSELDESKNGKGLTDKERNKGIKSTIKKMRVRFSTLDYSTAIYYYKGKGKTSRVLKLYDELIKYVPYDVEYRQEKALVLIQEERHQDALTELNIALAISPYNYTTLEYIGDVYNDKNKNNTLASDAKALSFYKLSKKYYKGNYSVNAKITRIEGQKNFKKLFTTKTFGDLLADNGWKNKYKNEDAVILLYTRDLLYDSIAHVEVYQQMMIKILNEAGAKRWTEYDFGFLGSLNTLKVIKLNGTEVSPDKQGSYVVIKNLEPGDIIQIDGVQEWNQQSEMDQELALIHYVSFEAPIYYHKFEVAVPQKKYLGYMYHKIQDVLEQSNHDGFDFYKWEYNNLPKVENEDATLDLFDLYGSIMISTIPDWSKLVDWYLQTTYGKTELTYEVKEALDSIVKPNMTVHQKVEAIYNYLTKEIKYSYVSFLQSGYVPKEPGLTLSSRIGDCKDVATLMIVMLRAIGVEANYALVKTNAYNHQTMLPSLYFDHVVVQYIIDEKPEYLDMTTDFYPYYVLTENDANAPSLLIKEGVRTITRLPNDDLNPNKNKVEYAITAQLNIDKTIDLEANVVYPGIAGGSTREYFSTISEQEKKNFIIEQSGKEVFTDITLIDHHFENMNTISKPLKATYHFKATEFSDEVANLLIFRIPYLNVVKSSSVISGKHRNNTINVDKLCNTDPSVQKIELLFPENYRLIKLPDDVTIKSKYGSYKAHFTKIKNGIAIEKEQIFYTKIVPANEFNEFKAYYLKMLNSDKTKIAIQHL